MDGVLHFLKTNWLFSLIIMVMVFILFKLNGIGGGFKYLALIFCVVYPVIAFQGLISAFLFGKKTEEAIPIRQDGVTVPMAEAQPEEASLAKKLMPLGVGLLLFILIFVLALDGREKIFALTYAVVFFFCMLFYDLVMLAFNKIVGVKS